MVQATAARALFLPRDAWLCRRLGLETAYDALRAIPPPSTFEMVHNARAAGLSASSLVYGEVFLASARSWLQRLGVAAGSTVLDVGSGRGMLLLAAHSLGARAIGIEVNQRLAMASKRALENIGIEVVHDNADSCDWPVASHVVCTWTCFDEALRSSLSTRLEHPPAIVATTTFGIRGSVEGRSVATTAGWLSTWIAKHVY